MVRRDELAGYLEEFLDASILPDYCPNGLQVEGRAEIRSLATGVTACQALIDEAARRGADALLVHHGLFWTDPEGVRIERSLRARLAALLTAEVSLFAYHLPLDRHPEVGNNAVFAHRLGAAEVEPAFVRKGAPIGLVCRYQAPLPAAEVFARITRETGREPLIAAGGPAGIESFGVVTGADPGSTAQAARLGLDLFVTGEASEPVVHLAREEGLHFVAAGHHATERFGVQALGEHLADRFDLRVEFIEIPNPV